VSLCNCDEGEDKERRYLRVLEEQRGPRHPPSPRCAAVPLISIPQPKYHLGQAAAQLLLEKADAPAEHEHRRFVFTPGLITRASSQPGASSVDAAKEPPAGPAGSPH
jgi:DNA-binding LacI/PurR family transcriptional regulator